MLPLTLLLACPIFGALILGAADLLRGKKATTYWAALHLLDYFGAIPINDRVAIDGRLVSAALLCGEQKAQDIQLEIRFSQKSSVN